MATIDLIVLGIVKKEPLSAYDIQKLVEYRNISRWVKISTPSIYKKVIQLEEKGYITSTTIKDWIREMVRPTPNPLRLSVFVNTDVKLLSVHCDGHFNAWLAFKSNAARISHTRGRTKIIAMIVSIA